MGNSEKKKRLDAERDAKNAAREAKKDEVPVVKVEDPDQDYKAGTKSDVENSTSHGTGGPGEVYGT
jgi:hypothetical protein